METHYTTHARSLRLTPGVESYIPHSFFRPAAETVGLLHMEYELYSVLITTERHFAQCNATIREAFL